MPVRTLPMALKKRLIVLDGVADEEADMSIVLRMHGARLGYQWRCRRVKLVVFEVEAANL
jgi:hypothetical protein